MSLLLFFLWPRRNGCLAQIKHIQTHTHAHTNNTHSAVLYLWWFHHDLLYSPLITVRVCVSVRLCVWVCVFSVSIPQLYGLQRLQQKQREKTVRRNISFFHTHTHACAVTGSCGCGGRWPKWSCDWNLSVSQWFIINSRRFALSASVASCWNVQQPVWKQQEV